MKFSLDIQSISDVITNSSSELFLINSGMPDKEFRKILTEKFIANGYTKEELEDESMIGEIWMEPGNRLHLDFPIMCNSDIVYGILCEIFGKENVHAER